MISVNEDALICDLGEVYQIYDYKQLPALLVATFAIGLKDDSRIKRIMSGLNENMETYLLAGMFDRLSLLVWFKTKDGQNNRNRPKSMVEVLTPSSKNEKTDDTIIFNSGEEYEEMRSKLIGGG
jgi:hypothetical protein